MISFVLPHKRVSILEVGQVGLVAVHEAKIVLASDEQDGRVGTKAADLGKPHRLAIAQRLWVADGEAQQYHIRSESEDNSKETGGKGRKRVNGEREREKEREVVIIYSICIRHRQIPSTSAIFCCFFFFRVTHFDPDHLSFSPVGTI